MRSSKPLYPNICDICMNCLLHCKKHAPGIVLSSVSPITPSTAVEKLGAMSSRGAFVRLRDRRGLELWIVSAHAPTDTGEDFNEEVLYDELK
ncbi:hypothetical protein RB195_000022 [Necator americanus]|uniref:Uncharacterized protein n=1 Tax=Necator americanus TaxID=51031 RepID=A0ABR1DAM2_NECAM